MSQKLQEIINNAHLIQKSFTDPTTIVVTDTEQYLFHLRAEFDTTHIPVGTPIKEISNPLMEKSLKTGEISRMVVGPERFGFPFTLTVNPVIDQNKVVGLLMTSTSTEKIDSLRTMSSELAATAEQLNATTEEVVTVSNVIADKVQIMTSDSEMISKTVESVYEVIESIQYIATQSNILGLNASIEAVRAGEYGKGFTVVANEIRRMADQSKESAVNIINFLEKVKEAANQNNRSIQDIASMMEEHAKSIQELTNSFAIISSAAEELKKKAK